MTTKTNTEPEITTLGLVDYGYFARELNVRVSTVRTYANGPERQRLDSFPEPATTVGNRTPLFRKDEADTFIATRRAGSTTGKGRLKTTTLTDAQRTALTNAAQLTGREIKLDDRRAVRQVIYEELELPVLRTTKKENLPSVDTATIKKLYKQTGHEFLRQLLTYRGVDVPTQ